MDIHPFAGNRETRAMAADNILHMIGNYTKCSVCRMVVLVWLMDDPWVRRSIEEGLSAMQIEVESFTLTCSPEELTRRWKEDRECEWRTDQWLAVSLKSLTYFASLDNVIDTTTLPAERVAAMIAP